MDLPVAANDPLAQPTRARLFVTLGDLHREATTDELAEILGLHPNGVRVHLERLADAGLIARSQRRGSRGRPSDVWSVDASAKPGGDAPTAYADLAKWLAHAILDGHTTIEEIEREGESIGRDLAAKTGESGTDALFTILSSLGFMPEQTSDGDETSICLRNCPYREVAGERQPLVCGLHRGMTRGMLVSLDPDAHLDSFEIKDPFAAGCMIRITDVAG
jgi:predicted ArsR family transcriptional regulator